MVKTKKTRKGPSESATKFTVSTKKKGNDGNMWEIIKNKNGVKRWKKIKNKSRKKRKNIDKIKRLFSGSTHFIHDNGGRPFKVVINGKKLDIFTFDKDENEKLNENKDYNKLVKSYKNLKKIFIPKGIDASGDPWKGGKGNTILAHISGHKYLLIGSSIYEFETKKETILEFYSQVGNSDVPYPLAVGEKNVYFLSFDGEYISKEYFEGFPKEYNWAIDGYSRLWGISQFTDKTLGKKTKKFPKLKIIAKRLW